MSLVSPTEFAENLQHLREEVLAHCQEAGRAPQEVEILAVTKVHPVDAWHYAADAGLPAIGENRVQEAVEKVANYDRKNILYKELIGHLQTNKAKLAAEIFDRVQSVDSVKLAKKLSKAAEEQGKTLAVLLQVNTDLDPAKSGFSPEEFLAVLAEVQELPHLQIDGLMTIGRLTPDFNEQRSTFAGLHQLRERARAQSGLSLPVLSMGMSGDIRAAILEGSTQVRVGTALFGART